ncbi:putative phospholipase B-like 2 [Centruroides sculpturatus]|uniref:putative phospholipase B-like 2 n=1 Tax=Centruroides sculpturatus TaxID=218467 RepID=UPI000C6E271D|nr:putative phospholipase B-like 2 [Centruroides sculpturatus]XP_023216255.1 putative phospholipase B-like 2 [Centruroides sculpturatus]
MKGMIFAALLPVFVSCLNEKTASIIWDEGARKFVIKDFIINNSVAWASFEDGIFTTGWSYLEVHTDPSYSDSFQAYAAGLVEGYLTADLISKHWNNLYLNYCKNEEYCDKLKTFLQINMDFMNKNIQENKTSYWNHVALILKQVKGLQDGYEGTPSLPDTRPDFMGVMLFNLFGDLIDLEVVFNKGFQNISENTHCSALIKFLPGYKDLYVAHDAWNDYSTMLRILKKYVMHLKVFATKDNRIIPGYISSFSSYPGCIFSGDDFYILSSGLVALETSIANTNTSSFQYIKPDRVVLEWIRNLVANRLATGGRNWADIFSLFNSGTYNNQWMIVDYKKFVPNNEPQKELLWILEQLPNYIESKDQTNVLIQQGFWSSYNIPYYSNIFNMSGHLEKVKMYGDYFTYDKAPRALIFKRDQGKVTDLNSMMKMMRYNDFKNDPLSRCNCTPPYSANNAIASRMDLNPENGTYLCPFLRNAAFGAIDMKLTNYSMQKNYQFIAYSGPTYDQQPVFKWSTSIYSDIPHSGHPDEWNFKPVLHHWLNV